MKKNLLLLLTLVAISGSVSAMENEQSNPGDEAIKNHPHAYLATKIAGGTFGGFCGFVAATIPVAFADLLLTVAGGASSQTKFQRFKSSAKFLVLISPFVYLGYKGGEAVAEQAWHPVWNGVDKIQKNEKCKEIMERMKKGNE